jgi:YbbR domain-containing protein
MMKSIDRLLASRSFLKVLSVLVAILVWFYLVSDRGTEVVRTATVPLEYLNVPSDMSVTSGVRDVDIQVSGTRKAALSLADSVASQVDLKGLGPGSYRRPVQAILSSGLRLVEVSPPFVDFDLTRLVSRVLPVKVLVPEDLPPEYRLEEEKVEPGGVSVKGPEQMMASLDNVWVAPSPEQLLQEKELSLPIIPFPGSDQRSPLMIEPAVANLTFRLIKGFPRKIVPVRVELKGEPSHDFQVEAVVVDPPELTIQGPFESIERIDQVILAPIDVTGLASDVSEIVTAPDPADDAQIVDVPSVRVRINLAPRTERRLFAKMPVRLAGRSIYPGWRVEPPEVNVILEGPPSLLDSAEAEGSPVDVFVDVTNLVSQKITVPVKTTVRSRGITLADVDPPNVTVYALTE